MHPDGLTPFARLLAPEAAFPQFFRISASDEAFNEHPQHRRWHQLKLTTARRTRCKQYCFCRSYNTTVRLPGIFDVADQRWSRRSYSSCSRSGVCTAATSIFPFPFPFRRRVYICPPLTRRADNNSHERAVDFPQIGYNMLQTTEWPFTQPGFIFQFWNQKCPL